MSLRYFLDGYNIIKNMPALAGQKLEDGRSRLIKLIETFRPEGSRRNSITVVFDGRPGIWSEPVPGSVKVIFSSEESADDRIKKMVEGSSNKKQIVVVTDDRDIKYHVRALGASVMSVKEFCGKLKSPSAGISGETGKAIPKMLEYEITSEMEKIWLKEKS